MSEQVGRQSEGGDGPVAWVRGNGNVMMRYGDHGIGYEERKRNGRYIGLCGDLPADAVPLVPATELNNLRTERDNAWLEVAEARNGAPQLPALDTPEALRYAADVVEAFSESTNAHQTFGESTDRMDWNAVDLRREADRRDTVDAEREARIEELAADMAADWGWTLTDLASNLDALGYRKTDGAV